MYLRTLRIQNFRSLENVELERLGQFNVLIGRNNAGKSSVFGALAYLNDCINGRPVSGDEVTANDTQRSVGMYLEFALRDVDREDFIAKLIQSGCPPDQRDRLLASPLLRAIRCEFASPPGYPTMPHLRGTWILAADNQWARVQELNGEPNPGQAPHRFVNIDGASNGGLDFANLDIGKIPGLVSTTSVAAQGYASTSMGGPATMWFHNRLVKYLADAFFFSPFRHSMRQHNASQTSQLAQDGSNLGGVLHTILSNDRDMFDAIGRFAQDAVPDVGKLQTPLGGSSTEIAFRSPAGGYPIRLHSMGGGIEQLLMVATVLIMTGDESTIFVEEPETHLHSGAQRFLIEKLYAGHRQVFVTTHSPTFINVSRPRSVYQVKQLQGCTHIAQPDTDRLAAVLDDIGAKNSDVLMSDAVLFVEGPGDRSAMEAWSETLNMPLSEHNVTILTMGGGRYAVRTAPIRAEVLIGISHKAPVPHLFVLDRDERGPDELAHILAVLHKAVHVFEKRELENYLLVPRAILAALRAKHRDSYTIVERVSAATESEVQTVIATTASGLRDLVLLKRIRMRLGGLVGGLLPDDGMLSLMPHVSDRNFPTILLSAVKERFDQHLASLDVRAIVSTETNDLNRNWSDPDHRLRVVPGDEILSAVFRHFGSEYKKPQDTARIALEMHQDEISPEIEAIGSDSLSC